MSASFITPGHVRAFQAVTTQLYGEVTLMSCRINGEAGVAIVLMEHVGEGKVGVMPLFVVIPLELRRAERGASSSMTVGATHGAFESIGAGGAADRVYRLQRHAERARGGRTTGAKRRPAAFGLPSPGGVTGSRRRGLQPKLPAEVGRQLAFELSKIGGNLNQLSHHANAVRAMPDRVALHETLNAIVKATEALTRL